MAAGYIDQGKETSNAVVMKSRIHGDKGMISKCDWVKEEKGTKKLHP